jgi:hypothetical protein
MNPYAQNCHTGSIFCQLVADEEDFITDIS